MGASTGGLSAAQKVLLVCLLSVLGIRIIGGALGDDDSRGEVIRVIDGDTLIAEVAGEELTIRLLNIDTPETKHPDHSVQCLGLEATAFLTERLPAGTEIDLEYDDEREDRYGRTLAGVFESDSLVNAEIAAAGFGVPVLFEPNDRFLRPVTEAYEDARENARGLFSPEVDCTIPAQIASLDSAVASIPVEVEGDPAEALGNAESVVSDLDALRAGLEADGLPRLGHAVMLSPRVDDDLARFRREARNLHRSAGSKRDSLGDDKSAYDEEQEGQRREQEERDRREREEQEQREREEREELEPPRREEVKKTPPATSKSSSSDSDEQSSGSSPSQRSGTKSDSDQRSGSGGSSSGSKPEGKHTGGEKSGSSCTPYGPEIPYSNDGGYSGKRYGMPGGKTFRKCS